MHVLAFLLVVAVPIGCRVDASGAKPCMPDEPCISSPAQDAQEIMMLQMPDLQAVKAHTHGSSHDVNRKKILIDAALIDSFANTNGTDAAVICQTKAAWDAMTAGSCFTTKYMWFCGFLVFAILVLFFRTASVNKMLAKEQGKVRALRARVKHEKLAREDAEMHEKHLRQVWGSPKDFKIALVRDIKDRNCIDIDFEARKVNLKRPLDFVSARRPNFPFARFKRPDDALIILGDVADLLRVFENAYVLIEGNTEASGMVIDDWAMELAQERAELVKRTVEACGIEPYRLDAIGLPGALGTNTHEIVLKIVKIEP